jgi:hypothetical protein
MTSSASIAAAIPGQLLSSSCRSPPPRNPQDSSSAGRCIRRHR